MNWLEGSIEAATSATTSKEAIFVIFVSGNDEQSERMASLMNTDNIRKLLLSDDFVTIKAESDTLSYSQFAAIYVDVQVPSIFFIGTGGVPIEIITSQIASAEELEEKIKNVLITSGREIPNMTVPAESPLPSTTNYPGKDNSGSDSDEMVDDEQASLKKAEMKGTADEMVEGQTEPDTYKNVEMDENILLPEACQKLDPQLQVVHECETGNEQELRRRRTEVQNPQQWQHLHELQEIKETIRREKLKEDSIRDRILAQIAADRAETAQRFQPNLNMPTDSTSIASTKAAGDGATAPEMIRIQFRFATGENLTQNFKCDDTLEKVRNYVRISLLPGTGITDFSLATMYPKGELGTEHDKQTLEELGIFHSAVILVTGKESDTLPKGIISVSEKFFNLLRSMVMIILSPIVELFQFIRSIAPGGEVQGGENESFTIEAAQRRSDRIRFGVPPAEANSDEEGDN